MKHLYLLIFCILFLTGCSNSSMIEKDDFKPVKSPSIKFEEETLTDTIESVINSGTEEVKEMVTEVEDIIDKTVEENLVTDIESVYKGVSLAFVGDMYLSDTLYDYYEKENSITGFMSEAIWKNFKSVDIMVANHEYASTDLPDSAKDKRQLYNFKAPTEREFLWNELGVDVLSLANNHAMDYGEQSLFDTMETLDSLNLAHIGAGKNLEEAKESYITEVNGKKVAILATCRFVVDGEWYATENSSGVLTTYTTTPYFDIVKKEITRLKEEENCDFVIVYVHFGTEKKNTPNENQPIIAHGYIDSGADLVIGSHAHTLQGVEIYNGKPIYYNLGNFLFSSYTVDTMVVNIKINENNTCSTSIVPCIAGKYKVKEATGDDYKRILDYIESISINVEIDENGNVYEK